jgi:hypothetical protein
LRSVGDVVDAVTATRVDPPAVAALKGSLAMRRVLARAARDVIPGAPQALRVMVTGRPVHLDRRALDRLRTQVLRRHHRNSSREAMAAALAQAAWRQVNDGDRDEFLDVFADHRDVERFLDEWWRPVDPREVLLWLADAGRTGRYVAGVFSAADGKALAASYRLALDTGTWSVADAALVDDLSARLGLVPERTDVERGFYEVELLDEVEAEAVALGSLRGDGDGAGTGGGDRGLGYRERTAGAAGPGGGLDAEGRRDLLLWGRVGRPGDYAHCWSTRRRTCRRCSGGCWGGVGRSASWTVVGDAAQASWGDAAEAAVARDDAFGRNARRQFHMGTNYRNAREIFDYAAAVILPLVPDADIPEAVREVGVQPVEVAVPASEDAVVAASREAVAALTEQVEGAIAVIAPARWSSALAGVMDGDAGGAGRVTVTDPLTVKGLEYDATVVVDPDEIAAESPGGARVLYVALTRAAHRMHVLRCE